MVSESKLLRITYKDVFKLFEGAPDTSKTRFLTTMGMRKKLLDAGVLEDDIHYDSKLDCLYGEVPCQTK